MKVTIVRVSLSLPCKIPVLPGTGRTDAPIKKRTEYCATDAWWFTGKIPVCDQHIREVCKLCGWSYNDLVNEIIRGGEETFGKGNFATIPNGTESKPWTDRHRYPEAIAREAVPGAGRP